MKILPKMPKSANQRMLCDRVSKLLPQYEQIIYLREDPVPGEGPVRLEEWNAVDKDRDRGQASDDLSVDPFAVSVGTHLASTVEVDAVKTSDGDSEHELEESKDESYEGTEHASAAGVVANEVESTHFAW